MYSTLGFRSTFACRRGTVLVSGGVKVAHRSLTTLTLRHRRLGSSLSLSSSSSLFSASKPITFYPNIATYASRRSFYEKAKGNEDDTKPNEFFASFGTKNPNAQAVPKELHKSNVQAVSDAEVLNRLFLLFVCGCLLGMLYYSWLAMYEDTGGHFQRPDGYGVCSAPDRLRVSSVAHENNEKKPK